MEQLHFSRAACCVLSANLTVTVTVMVIAVAQEQPDKEKNTHLQFRKLLSLLLMYLSTLAVVQADTPVLQVTEDVP